MLAPGGEKDRSLERVSSGTPLSRLGPPGGDSRLEPATAPSNARGCRLLDGDESLEAVLDDLDVAIKQHPQHAARLKEQDDLWDGREAKTRVDLRVSGSKLLVSESPGVTLEVPLDLSSGTSSSSLAEAFSKSGSFL